MSGPFELTVAPTDIRTFATVLDELTQTLRQLRSEVMDAQVVDFGVYANSHTASERYVSVVEARLQGVERLIATSERFTEGTNQLAREYTDVSDLNTAHAEAITAVLGESEGTGK